MAKHLKALDVVHDGKKTGRKWAFAQQASPYRAGTMGRQFSVPGRLFLADIANQMEQTEKDIVNRMISEQTLKRQQDITTRLLESEKAEQERDQDEQRKSEEAKNAYHRNPDGFDEYKRLKLKEMELLRTVPPTLNSYYRQKVNDYFQSIDK